MATTRNDATHEETPALDDRRVVVALSGGVDSSVAACLLKEQGLDVQGVYLKISPDADPHDAERVANDLGIPLTCVTPEPGYDLLVDYLCSEYNRGRTPNPCVLCNRAVKFAALLDLADAIGAGRVATGHYARIVRVAGHNAVARAPDAAKEQSYMLAGLSAGQLSRVMLPLGDMTKTQVRRFARERGLHTADRSDSQEVCFVPDNNCAAFLAEQLAAHVSPGDIVDIDGAVIGRHKGIQFYTVGQRRGLGAHGAPRYVLRIDAEANRLITGPSEACLEEGLTVSGINWVAGAPPLQPFTAEVQIRYMHHPATARITPRGSRADVDFVEPQRSPAPGQAAVIYDEDVVVGAGWIDGPTRYVPPEGWEIQSNEIS